MSPTRLLAVVQAGRCGRPGVAATETGSAGWSRVSCCFSGGSKADFVLVKGDNGVQDKTKAQSSEVQEYHLFAQIKQEIKTITTWLLACVGVQSVSHPG